jgi:hypothetical protein
MVMARKSASNPSTVMPQEGGMPGDAGAVLNDWLAKQNSLLDASLAQITGSQVAMLSWWLELQNDLARQWQAQAADAIRLAWGAGGNDDDTHADALAMPAALYQPARRVLDDWWSQWSYFWQRGGEQLA